MSETYTISDLAKEFEITTRTIRFYEDKQLLKPKREGQKRIYNPRDRVNLTLIMRGKRLGFSLNESRTLIELYDPKSGNQKQLNELMQKITAKRKKLKQSFDDLQALNNELDIAEARCQEAIYKLDSSKHV